MTTVLFQPDTCLPRDPAGWGLLLNGHAQEHELFRTTLLSFNVPIVVPSFDILSWRDEPEFVQQWLVNHEAIHESIRSVTGVGGNDLSLVDLSKDDEFFEWLDDHAQEHSSFRSVLNVG